MGTVAAALVIVGAALALAAQALIAVDAAGGDSRDYVATVRISALKSEDGAVRVALQDQDEDGAWGERQHPRLDTVGTSARTGVWLNSSLLVVSVAATASTMPDVHAEATSGDEQPLFCIVSHGGRDDFFWRLVRGYSRQAALDAGSNVRFSQSPDGAQQAAAIQRCSDDGAAVIASTLADPDAVRDALLAAKEAGARIITFNSGADAAESVGSELHIALDEAAAGRLVGEEFNRRGLTGNIGCLLHEVGNVGLEQRCDALAETYTGGETFRINLPVGDPEAVQEAVEARLLDADQPELAGLLTLNADTLLATLRGVIATADQMGHDVQIAGIGQNAKLDTIDLADRRRHLALVISHAGETQGYLITAALNYIHTYPAPASFISSTTILRATPFSFDAKVIQADDSRAAEVLRRVAERLALGDEYLDE